MQNTEEKRYVGRLMTSTHGPKVLVVEDEAIVALDIANGLRASGYEVVGTFDTSEKALEAISTLRPDVVLMDIVLKGAMDGIAAAGLISDTFSIPVIFLTAHADEATLQRAKLSQPYGYILKPFEIIDLHSTIEVTLHRHQSEIASRPMSSAPLTPRLKSEGGEAPDESGALDALPARIQFLREIRLFSPLSDADLEQFAKEMVVRRVETGEFITHEGHEVQGGFIVITGRIALIKVGSSGKELIVELLPPGDVFGLLTTIDQKVQTNAMRAQAPSQLLWVPKTSFRLLLESFPALYKEVAEELAIRLRRAHEVASYLAHATAEARIVLTLLSLVPKFGRGTQKNDQCRIYITRRELSELAGTTPETAIRITKSLEREGLLDLEKPGVVKILNLQALQKVLKPSYGA